MGQTGLSKSTVLYALVHGYEIFADENQFARLIALREHEEPEFRRPPTDDAIAVSLVQLAKELMRREPAARLPSAEAVNERLQEI